MLVGGLLVGILCSLLGFIYLQVARPQYNQNGGMTPVVVLVCFLIGSSMFSTIATVISSGVATTFVCLAEDPDALRRYTIWHILLEIYTLTHRVFLEQNRHYTKKYEKLGHE